MTSRPPASPALAGLAARLAGARPPAGPPPPGGKTEWESRSSSPCAPERGTPSRDTLTNPESHIPVFPMSATPDIPQEAEGTSAPATEGPAGTSGRPGPSGRPALRVKQVRGSKGQFTSKKTLVPREPEPEVPVWNEEPVLAESPALQGDGLDAAQSSGHDGPDGPSPDLNEPTDGRSFKELLSERREALFHRFFEGTGELSSAGRDFVKSKDTRDRVNIELKEELIFLMWTEVAGADNPSMELAKKTGLTSTTVDRLIQNHTRRILLEDGGAEMLLRHRLQLEEVRHKGRVETVEIMQNLTVKALARVDQTLHQASAREAATIAGIMTDKSLLLSGQPTSRIARTDERLMNENELKARAKANESKMDAMDDDEVALRVVTGGRPAGGA